MLSATELYPPQDVDALHFEPPPGIEIVSIDADSMTAATPSCVSRFDEVFITGTGPTSYCPLHPFSLQRYPTSSTMPGLRRTSGSPF